MVEMILIPAGKFMMGSPEREDGRNHRERLHEVTLRSFSIGKYAVTNRLWKEIMGTDSIAQEYEAPVTSVSWNDCQDFIERLNKNSWSVSDYRLPTEAEWEYACRAGTTTAYSFGSEITAKDANYRESDMFKPVAVGSYKPNAFGLYDMHGNVWEWCEDWYEEYVPEPAINPRDKNNRKYSHVISRGGCFSTHSSGIRSATRMYTRPEEKYDNIGFRLARNIGV